MRLPRRQFLRLAAGTAALPALPYIARAQSYPVRPVRFVVGTGQDMIARIVGEKLSTAWGQQVIVDPRPGGGGINAAEFQGLNKALQRLERFWTDQILYRL